MIRIACLTKIDHIEGVGEELCSLGNVAIEHECQDKKLLKMFIQSLASEVIYSNPNNQKYVIDKELLDNTKIKTIVSVSRGLNHIDTEYCKQNNIEVIHLNSDPVTAQNSSTAEHALGLTLALLRHTPKSFDAVRGGEWNSLPYIGNQLQSLNVMVIGMGNLGTKYASYCKAIGSEIIEHRKGCSIKKGLEKADVISLHIPLNKENNHLVNDDFISAIKDSGAWIINTSRGSVVDEKAILEGLRSSKVRGYATDVLENESENIEDNPLIKSYEEGLNVIVTPHIAGCCYESLKVAHFRSIELLKNHVLKE